MQITFHLVVGLCMFGVGAAIFKMGHDPDITQETSPSPLWGLVHSSLMIPGAFQMLFGLGIAFAPDQTSHVLAYVARWVYKQIGWS